MSTPEEAEAPQAHDKDYEIIVNGSPKTLESDIVTFDEVVALAFPNHDPTTIYSVTFEKAKKPREGELVQGQSVEVHRHGTEFDVIDTGKS